MFKEATDDLDIAIKLDPTFTDSYLIKGKCAYLAGDTNTAFLCYQQLIIQSKEDPIMHIHAGNLLMASGAFEDAAKAFSNANETEETQAAYYQQAKVDWVVPIYSATCWKESSRKLLKMSKKGLRSRRTR